MANVAVQLADGGGKEVKTDNTWGWVKSLQNGVSAFSTNVEKIGSAVSDGVSVVASIFGGSEKKKDVASDAGSSSIVPLLALGGGLALLLK